MLFLVVKPEHTGLACLSLNGTALNHLTQSLREHPRISSSSFSAQRSQQVSPFTDPALSFLAEKPPGHLSTTVNFIFPVSTLFQESPQADLFQFSAFSKKPRDLSSI